MQLSLGERLGGQKVTMDIMDPLRGAIRRLVEQALAAGGKGKR